MQLLVAPCAVGDLGEQGEQGLHPLPLGGQQGPRGVQVPGHSLQRPQQDRVQLSGDGAARQGGGGGARVTLRKTFTDLTLFQNVMERVLKMLADTGTCNGFETRDIT